MSLSESAFGRRVSAAFSNGGFFENKFPLSPPQNDIPTYLRMLVCPALTNSPEKVSARKLADALRALFCRLIFDTIETYGY